MKIIVVDDGFNFFKSFLDYCHSFVIHEYGHVHEYELLQPNKNLDLKSYIPTQNLAFSLNGCTDKIFQKKL